MYCTTVYKTVLYHMYYIIFYMLYITYICVFHVWDQSSIGVCYVQRVVVDWEDFKVKWTPPPPSLPATDCTYGKMHHHAEGGAICSYLKSMQSLLFSTPTALKQHREQSMQPLLFSTPTALKQHREQSTRPVHYQVIVTIIKIVNQWSSDSVTIQLSVIQ